MSHLEIWHNFEPSWAVILIEMPLGRLQSRLKSACSTLDISRHSAISQRMRKMYPLNCNSIGDIASLNGFPHVSSTSFAWEGSDFANQDSYALHLTTEEQDEVKHALQVFKSIVVML